MDRRTPNSGANAGAGGSAPARNGGPPTMPTRRGRRNHLWIGASAPREGFSSGPQGDDEDWDPDAPTAIPETTAVAVSHGQVGVRNSRGKDIDTHELLKREAFYSESADCDSHFEKNRPCTSMPYGSSNQYVILDSWVKDLTRSNPSRGVFSWNFMVQGVSHDQNVGVKDKIDTVVEMQIGAFTIPATFPGFQMENPGSGAGFLSGFPPLVQGFQLFAPPDPSAVMGYTFGYFPYIGRITIELREIGLQSISQTGGIRYHFEADVIPVFPAQGTVSTALGTPIVNAANPYPVGLRVVPLPGFDTYVFTDPIKDVHGLSLVFRSVDQILPFPEDVIIGATVYTSLASWPYFSFNIPCATPTVYFHLFQYIISNAGLTRVFVSGMSTGNAAIDNWVNQAPGLLDQIPPGFVAGMGINGINFGESIAGETVNFMLAPKVNISALVPTAPPGGVMQVIPTSKPITIRFSSSRVRIPMRFKRVVQRLTNYQ